MMASGGGDEALTWQPQDEGLREICRLLEQQIAPTSDDKSVIWQRLQHYSQFPDFNNYLAFILARAEVRDAKIRVLSNLKLNTDEERSDWRNLSTILKNCGFVVDRRKIGLIGMLLQLLQDVLDNTTLFYFVATNINFYL